MLIWCGEPADASSVRDLVRSCPDGAETFAGEDGAGQLVLCDGGKVGSPGAFTMAATVLFTGGRYGRASGDYLFMVGLWTPDVDRDDLLSWYEQEHLPILLECPVWDGCRFVEVTADEGCQFYALHQMADRTALDSEARQRSRDTPWFHRLKSKTWFDEPFTRVLYRRIDP